MSRPTAGEFQPAMRAAIQTSKHPVRMSNAVKAAAELSDVDKAALVALLQTILGE